MANVGNVFYPTFTNVFLFSPRFFTFFYFHLNVYYIYGTGGCRMDEIETKRTEKT